MVTSDCSECGAGEYSVCVCSVCLFCVSSYGGMGSGVSSRNKINKIKILYNV